MVRAVFVGIYLLLATVLVFTGEKVLKSDSEYRKPLFKVILAGFCTAFFYTLFLMTPIYKPVKATFLLSCYYIGTDWIVIALLGFILCYIDSKSIAKRFFHLFVIAGIADTVSLLFNVFSHHVFTLVLSESEKFNMMYLATDYRLPEYMHLTFCYIILLLCFAALAKKTIVSPLFYKSKYYVFLIQLMLVVAINALCYMSNYPIDFSVLLYPGMAISICHFALYATPRGLIRRTNSYIVQDMSSPIICFDISGKCVYVNNITKETFDIKSEKDFQVVEDYFKKWCDEFYEQKKDAHIWSGRQIVKGELKYYDYEYRALKDHDKYIGCFFKLEDRTTDVIELKDEQYRATHDKLTGLYNREYFFEEGRRILQNEPNAKHIVVASNIKDFKLINELFGFEKGDEVLIKQAELINKYAHKNTITGRITADKFAMLMDKSNYNEKLFIDCIDSMANLTKEGRYKMHVYLGIYEVDDASEPIQTMLDKANMAIDRISGDLSQNIAYYDQKDMERLVHEKSVIADFDRAINNKEFCIFLQPQVDTKRNLLGAEALVRWNHPQRGLVFPGDFIPVIEKTGLIGRLDKYIWETAAAKLRDWIDRGFDKYHISVNISAKDFYYMDIYDTLTGIVKEYGIKPGMLKLEITETVLMSDVDNHMAVVRKLRDFGFVIEIDDFGSGYSSLNTLKDITADVLKLDMMFLRNSETNARGKIIIDSVVKMAKELEIPTVIEGVETEEQFKFLTDIGCTIFQGYYFSKPISVEKFEETYFVQCLR